MLVFAGWAGSAQSLLLTFEEVGDLPGAGIHHFDTVGPFSFLNIRCNCPTPSNHEGVGLFNSFDSNSAAEDNLYNTPKNSVALSHDLDVLMTLTAGGAFNIESMFLGNSHFQSPTLFLKGYLQNALIYELQVSIPNIAPSSAVEPSLVYTDINMFNVDRVEWSMSRINIGLATMDSISYSTASVPTPTILSLFGLGLAGLGWSRRKKVNVSR